MLRTLMNPFDNKKFVFVWSSDNCDFVTKLNGLTAVLNFVNSEQ